MDDRRILLIYIQILRLAFGGFRMTVSFDGLLLPLWRDRNDNIK